MSEGGDVGMTKTWVCFLQGSNETLGLFRKRRPISVSTVTAR